MATKKTNAATTPLEAIVDAVSAIEDPVVRYREATLALGRLDDPKERLVAVRDDAVLELAETKKMSLAQIAEFAGFSRGRAQQLVARGGPVGRRPGLLEARHQATPPPELTQRNCCPGSISQAPGRDRRA